VPTSSFMTCVGPARRQRQVSRAPSSSCTIMDQRRDNLTTTAPDFIAVLCRYRLPGIARNTLTLSLAAGDVRDHWQARAIPVGRLVGPQAARNLSLVLVLAWHARSVGLVAQGRCDRGVVPGGVPMGQLRNHASESDSAQTHWRYEYHPIRMPRIEPAIMSEA
jgi:hypothetical protein